MSELQTIPQSPPKTVNIPQSRPSSSSPKLHDLICVGFGTVGLGLAAALQDTDYTQSKTLFLEQKSSFSPSTSTSERLGSSFAHDLATLRSPTSKYTYLNYLCKNGSLDSVVGENGSPFPQTQVFAQYLSWAAQSLNGLVAYGKCVTDVRAVDVGLGNGIQLWAVTVQDVKTGRKEVLATRNVVFAQGKEAVLVRREVDLMSAVEAAKSACAGIEVRQRSRNRLEAGMLTQNQVLQEEKLNSLAVKSGRILRTCFEGDAAFSRRAVL